MSAARRPVALVTGGRRGIGLGIAHALAASGFDIAITDREREGAERALEELRARGTNGHFVQADLSDVAGHPSTVEEVTARLGPIDCLVNNAGMGSVERGDFLGLSPANFDAIVATNLRGTVFFTQAVVKAMLSADRPEANRSVINITSVSAAMSSPERLDYCITKAGLSAFSKGLALRLAETGIAVFEVRPGIIRSAMTAKVSERYDKLIADGLVPMKRWGEPSDVGEIVAALASGHFRFATGSVINADGALSIERL